MFSFSMEEFRSTPLPTEEEIMKSWQGSLGAPAISVVCMVYNQEQYIDDAMLGFLMQVTTFPFEVILHDDASTDSTAAIIKDYQARYPNIVKSILQTENQYSKGPSSVALFPVAIAKGEYIALCEGDDFWIQKDKLQIQYDALKENPEVDFCFHRSIEMLCDQENQPCRITNEKEGNAAHILPLSQIIREGGGMIKTAAIVLRRDIFAKLPAWYAECPVFDYVLKIIACQPKGALYLPHTMSLYRIAAQGSWTANLDTKYEKFVHDQDLSLRRLEAFIDPQYQKQVRNARSRLAMSASAFHFNNQNHKLCRQFALRSLKLAGRIKTQAIRNIIFSSNPSVFKIAYKLRTALRAAS